MGTSLHKKISSDVALVKDKKVNDMLAHFAVLNFRLHAQCMGLVNVNPLTYTPASKINGVYVNA